MDLTFLYDFIVPVGLVTISLVLLAAITGFFKKILPPRTRLKVHKVLGLCAVGVALIHGGIAFYFTFLV